MVPPNPSALIPRPFLFDEALIVLDKPSGLLTQPGRGAHLRDSLIVRVQREHPEALIVHRLDRDTSGVIVLARSPQVHRELSRQFHDRLVEKRYIAIVSGVVERDLGRIDAPLRKDMDHPPRHMIDAKLGREAITDYRVVERLAAPGSPGSTRLELTPLTGRSHQLRVHLAHLGHPVLGDPLYGDPHATERLMLHAESLTLDHPLSGERVTFTAPCPF